MGSAQSLFTSQNLIAAIILVGVITTVWRNHANTHAPSGLSINNKSATSKKGKKKRAAGETQDASSSTSEKDKSHVLSTAPSNISLPERTIPGGIPEPAADAPSSDVSKPVKEKKRKGKKSATSGTTGTASESATPVAGPSRSSTGSGSSTVPQAAKRSSAQPSTAESWTRVESRRKTSGQNPTTSDAGVTTATSVEEDGSSSGAVEKPADEEKNQSQKTLAEKVLPKGRKTAVDDMLESSHYPELSRVMRVAPAADEKPATGFSWGDYEDVEDIRGADADGEDDGGWGVVKSRGKAKHNPPSSGRVSAPETLTKKQKQNAAKREALKAAKADAEAERLEKLAKHKRELERSRIAEQFSRKGAGGTGRDVSGGMTATVSPEGKLVWD